ncbi:MAG: terpene cyclase/mutase family protein [Spirochaetes bacterium]|nr:terpene cyclase/mutase family protein [Spirochaetota bacterium]
MDRFLTAKQLQYFIENKSDVVRYLFSQNFPQLSVNSGKYIPLKSDLFRQPELKFLFHRNRNDYAGDVKKWDKIPRGVLWNLYYYSFLGFDKSDEFINNSIKFLNEKYLMPSGGFSFGWYPLSESTLWTGEYLFLLLNFGYQGEEIHSIKNWITENQNDDGGWFVSPVKNVSDALRFVFNGKIKIDRTKNTKSKSCVFSSISCLHALLLYRKIFKSDVIDEAIDRAAYFILNQQIIFKNELESLDGFVINKNFQSTGISIFGQIDMIKYLDIMSQTSYKNHQFVTSVFNYFVKEKHFEEGWLFNSKADYMMENEFSIKKNSGIDFLATIRLLKIFSRYN